MVFTLFLNLEGGENGDGVPNGGENGDGMPNGGEKEKPPPTFEEMWFDDPIEVHNKSIIFYIQNDDVLFLF